MDSFPFRLCLSDGGTLNIIVIYYYIIILKYMSILYTKLLYYSTNSNVFIYYSKVNDYLSVALHYN